MSFSAVLACSTSLTNGSLSGRFGIKVGRTRESTDRSDKTSDTAFGSILLRRMFNNTKVTEKHRKFVRGYASFIRSSLTARSLLGRQRNRLLHQWISFPMWEEVFDRCHDYAVT